MIKTDVLIAGAGLAGLSAARALRGRASCLLVEKNPAPGGLASSVRKNGFTFDHSGHLLHLRWKRTSDLILGLLKGNCLRLERDARIRVAGTEIPYPFQANLYGLPDEVRSECVQGFLDACLRAEDRRGRGEESFRDWSLRIFGAGISRHFMFPYNRKLWSYPLNRLTADWCGPFVPRPAPDEVLAGAYAPSRKAMGYNPVFYYPERGGIQALTDALAAGAESLRTGCELEAVDLGKKTARVRGLGEVKYKRLINTTPLKSFLGMSGLRGHAAKLRHNSVHVLNLGVRGPVSGAHWTYFPEKEFPFYRAGAATNFSRRVAPRGCASLYIELSSAGRKPDLPAAEKDILRGLTAAGVIGKKAEIVEKLWLEIPCAYVIYDADRLRTVPQALARLSAKGVHSIGRYGAWKYSFMEESVKEGIETAEDLLKGPLRRG